MKRILLTLGYIGIAALCFIFYKRGWNPEFAFIGGIAAIVLLESMAKRK